jgi:hypothetical protein
VGGKELNSVTATRQLLARCGPANKCWARALHWMYIHAVLLSVGGEAWGHTRGVCRRALARQVRDPWQTHDPSAVPLAQAPPKRTVSETTVLKLTLLVGLSQGASMDRCPLTAKPPDHHRPA